jgi:hypothetical protein
MNHVLYNRNGTRLYLHWRLLNVEPNRAIACEREFLCERRIVAAIGASFRILSPGHALLEALAERAESVDALPWQADAALVLCGAESIDWKRWSVVAGRYQPQVFERLPELRAIGLNIPELSSPRVQKLGHFMETLLPAAMAWARRISAAVGKA